MYVFKTLYEVRERTEAWLIDCNEELLHDALRRPDARRVQSASPSGNLLMGGTDCGKFTWKTLLLMRMNWVGKQGKVLLW